MDAWHASQKTLLKLLILVVLLFPFRKVLIQQWSVRVVDQSGAPIGQIRVSRSWDNYTFGLFGDSDLYTDNQGTITFPADMRRAPIPYWVSKAIWNVVSLGVHASFGTVGNVRLSDHDKIWERDVAPADLGNANCEGSQCTGANLHTELRVVFVEDR